MSAGAAPDIAQLGISVRSDEMKAATASMREMATAADATETKVKQVSTATDALVAALNRNTAANKNTADSHNAMQSGLLAAITGLSNLVAAQGKAREAEAATAASVAKTAAEQEKLTRARVTASTVTEQLTGKQRTNTQADNDAGKAVESLTDRYIALAAAKREALLAETRQTQAAISAESPVQARINASLGINRPNPARAAEAASFFQDHEEETQRINAMRAAMDPLWVSQENLNRTRKNADELLAKGVITQDTYTRTVNQATAAHDKLSKSIDIQTKGVGLQRHEWTNLSYQLNDIATMGMMGASPFQIAASQGGQILQTMGGAEGGFKGALSSMGESITSVVAKISPVVAGLSLLTIGLGVAAAAAMSYSNGRQELERSRFGAGQASGATIDQLIGSAERAANDPRNRISQPQARTVVADLNSTGGVNPEVYERATAIVGKLADKLKKDIPDASAEVVAGLQPNIAAFDRLNKTYLLTDDNGRQNIESMYNSGRAFEAQAVIVDLLNKKFKEATESSNFFVRGLRAIAATNPLNDPDFERLGKALAGGTTPEQQLERARDRVSRIEAQGPRGLPVNTAELASARADVEKLEKSMAQTAEESKAAKATFDNLNIGPFVESLNPAQKRIQDIRDRADAIEKHLANGGAALDKDGSAKRTMEALRAQAEGLTAELAKGGASLAAGLQQAQFTNKVAGFSPYATQRAQLTENDRVARETIEKSYPDFAQRKEQLEAQAKIFAEQVKALDDEVIRQAQQVQANGGGRYAKTVADAPASMQPIIRRSAAESGFSPDFISSIIWKESTYRNGLTSKTGAKGVGQFMPGTAAEMGVDVNDIESSVMGVGRYLRKIAGILNTTNEQDIAAAYNRGPYGQQKWIANGRNPLTQPAETRDYVDKVFTAGPGSNTLIKETLERKRQAELEAEILQMTKDAQGKDVEGLQARIEALRRTREEEWRGVAQTEDSKRAILEEAAAKAKNATASRDLTYSLQDQFNRDQLGRDRFDQAAYGRAYQQTGGYDFTTPRAKEIISNSRDYQGLVEAKNITTEALNGFASDLRRGATAAQAFGNALGRIGDRAITGLIDTVTSGLFKPAGGGGADLFGGIKSFFGFAQGGVMTNQGPMQLRSYARGGVASSPQLALYGEAGPEAYVPLPDGRRIPVAMQAGGRGSSSTGAGPTVITYNPQYNFPQVSEMTPAQVAAYVDQRQVEFAKNLPSLINDANKRGRG